MTGNELSGWEKFKEKLFRKDSHAPIIVASFTGSFIAIFAEIRINDPAQSTAPAMGTFLNKYIASGGGDFFGILVIMFLGVITCYIFDLKNVKAAFYGGAGIVGLLSAGGLPADANQGLPPTQSKQVGGGVEKRISHRAAQKRLVYRRWFTSEFECSPHIALL